MTAKTRREEVEINTIVKKLSDKGIWAFVLEALYNDKDCALTAWDIFKYIREHKGLNPYISRINDILNKMKEMGLVASMEIKGLRGRRWYLTEKGLNVCKMLLPEDEDEEDRQV
jgi:DNA gyrase/topoisomerase IV subunit A